jgi:cell division protein FtsW (lipid II flippase)
LYIIDTSKNKLSNVNLTTSSKSNYAQWILIMVLAIYILTVSILTSNTEAKIYDLPMNPDFTVDRAVIFFIGIGLIISYLRNPFKYKSCPNNFWLYIGYFPIILALLVFVQYAVGLGALIANIPEIGWTFPLVEYYQGEQIILTTLVWHDFVFKIFVLIVASLMVYNYVDDYKSIQHTCQIWDEGKKMDHTRKWKDEFGFGEQKMKCVQYGDKLLCQNDLPKRD